MLGPSPKRPNSVLSKDDKERVAEGIRWFKALDAEYIPERATLGKEAQRWLRDFKKPDEVNDDMFRKFLDKLTES